MLFKFFIFLFVLSFSDARLHPGYSQDESCESSNTDWLSKLDDSRLLRQISIPGTHDSLALYGGEQWQCQTMPLYEQLIAGIRSLDVRCRHVNNTFRIYHQFVDQQIDFDDVITIIRKFLLEHPRETILMRIKSEWLPENNTRTFEEVFEDDYYIPNSDLFWLPKKTLDNVLLKDVRGKVIILQDFKPKFNLLNHIQMKRNPKYGLIWGRDMAIQDDFTLLTTWALYTKWLKVKQHIVLSNTTFTYEKNSKHKSRFLSSLSSFSSSLSSSSSSLSSSLSGPVTLRSPKLFINFLSGSVGVKPYFVASGNSQWGSDSSPHYFGLINMLKAGNKYDDFPKRKCLLGGRYCLLDFLGTNSLLYEYLQNNRLDFIGIIYADFPGCGLIQSIIDINFH